MMTPADLGVAADPLQRRGRQVSAAADLEAQFFDAFR
jgi:hypothetical protein